MTDEIVKKSEISKEVKEKKAILTEDEIENLVKAFILAFINDRIQIKFPTTEQVKENFKPTQPNMTDEEAIQKVVADRKEFRQAIEICSGTKEATDGERKEAISYVFARILSLRSNHRITGSFEDYDIKKRIDELEEKLDATNNVVKELIEWLIKSEDGYNGNLS